MTVSVVSGGGGRNQSVRPHSARPGWDTAPMVTSIRSGLVSATTRQPTLSIRLWVSISYWVLKEHSL